MKRFIIQLIIVTIILIGCSNRINDNIPLSDDKPTLLAFCNNTDVLCFDISNTISPYLVEQYGEGAITQTYFNIDSSYGARIFDELQLSNIPSYVIFDADQREVFRHIGEVDLNQLNDIFSQLLVD